MPDQNAADTARTTSDQERPDLPDFAAGLLEEQPFTGYHLHDCLGATDRLAVFKADDHNMNRTVAVKVMRPYPGRQGVVEEFFSLAGSIARLRSSAIARGLDAGRGGGGFYMAYEYINGESLAARLARRQTGKMSEKESLRLAGMVAGLLRDLFDQGHPHGNVTAANLMLIEGGRGKLTDIGFAWNLAWPDDAAAFAARPEFLAPERIAGDVNTDIRADLYSLGAIWYRALLGVPVFSASSPDEVVRMHLEAAPTPPREVDPRLTTATSRLLLWLLEKDREARPKTPREFLRKLASHPLLAPESEPETGGQEKDDVKEDEFGEE